MAGEYVELRKPQEELDAGALFVLKSKGSWLHCGYHLTTSIVAPPLLSLPYAFSFLGWTAGIISLTIAAAVTFYSYNLISLVLEHYAHLGCRHLRFRDMAHEILGLILISSLQILPDQDGASIMLVQFNLQSAMAIYVLLNPDGAMKLYDFVAIFGCLMLVLAQIPSFHSLRHINLVSLLLCLAYSACATGGSIYIGNSSNAPATDYSLSGDTVTQIFGIFNALSIIATAFGNGIIPEIQATLAPPVKGKMFKGLCVCYAVAAVTFFSVAISGYWAFGNQADSIILTNFLNNGDPLLPKWFIIMTNMFVILQISAVGVVYLQPANEVIERMFGDPTSAEFSARNVIPRLIARSLAVIVATTLAAMLPFFGDFSALNGAFGFIPIDFVLPAVFFNLTFNPSRRGPVLWLNANMVAIFTTLAVIAAVAAVRQIVVDADTYKLFADV
ncbi:Amino acid transporter, transmembrane domain [Dillenia turbinata]|uniref:Amino acid transporter, transmembrane domain n=1 Tax=Dillenia turbinata TaxID=194707 RepID=A0AAN8V4U4_9MAGN